MISNYFKLTNELILSYLKSSYPTQSSIELQEISSTDSSTQYQLKHQSKTVLHATLNKLSETAAVINLVAIGTVNESFVIDWESLLQTPVKFPINEISISSDLIKQFNKAIENGVRDPKALKEVFKSLGDGTKRQAEEREAQAIQQESKEDSAVRHDERQQDKQQGRNLREQEELSELRYGGNSKQIVRPNDMPDFDDELEIRARPRDSRNAFPSIGDQDLNPPGLPKYPELKPFIDPLRRTGDGGMYPSADHPLFGSRGTGNTSRTGVPPGARYDDPYGEDNFEALGSGLPGNLRGALGGNQDFSKPSGRNPPGFGDNGFGGSGFGGGSFPF